MTPKYIAVLLTLFSSCVCSCTRYLDIKPNQSLVVPSQLDDFEALLNNTSVVNSSGVLPEISSDDPYADPSVFASVQPTVRNCYLWAPQPYADQYNYDWNQEYHGIFYDNVVLDGLAKLPAASHGSRFDHIYGSALFYRSFAYFELVQEFAQPYQASSAPTDPGVPLRLTSDPGPATSRSTVQKVYQQILKDLNTSLSELPETVPYPTYPCKAASWGLLARIYLQMGNYPDAELAADSCLASQNSLMDYNSLNASARFPFTRFNPETIYYSELITMGFLYSSQVYVDTNLYNSYEGQDLRRSLFYTGQGNQHHFRGTYTGNRVLFSGICTDEMYLIDAEAAVRNGHEAKAQQQLNTLLQHRYAKASFTPLSIANADSLLSRILLERRKELVFRGLRWFDLERLNQDPKFRTTLIRILDGKTYTLPPGDPRYVFPIPDEELQFSSLPQNPR